MPPRVSKPRPAARAAARPTPRAGRRAYHHGDLRRALVDGALAAIAQHGVEAVSLRDVARRAGVSAAAPYRHFADKDELLAAVATECSQRLLELIAEALAGAGDDPIDRFRATGVAYVLFAWQHPAHFRVIHLPALAERLPSELRRDVDASAARDQDELDRAGQRGALTPPAPLTYLAGQCLMHGLASMIVEHHDAYGALDRAAVIAIAEAVADVLGYGLLPRGPRDPATAHRPPPSWQDDRWRAALPSPPPARKRR